MHPRTTPGGRVTDAGDLPAERTVYALRDIEALKRQASRHGKAIGTHTAKLVDHPLPWTKMRQVYRLLGLVRRFGADRVEAACTKALETEVVDVGLIGRMLERATETKEQPPPPPSNVIAGRFSRDTSHFSVNGGAK